MESMMLTEFLSVCSGSGLGLGSGSGKGWGEGEGSGRGSGRGTGLGWGLGSGSGTGSGEGEGWGTGWGEGTGSGTSTGEGTGLGWGSGLGFPRINGMPIALIDEIPTALTHIHGSIAKGYIVRDDLSLAPCYVVKQDDTFAHGETLHAAMEALRDKLFEGMPDEERCEAFAQEHEAGKLYPNTDYFVWHHRLTGSCLMGRQEFARAHNVDMAGSMTPEQFIELTEDAYGGDVIRMLRGYYKEV